MENEGSEPLGQRGLAESELKSWLSMDRDFDWKMKDLSQADREDSQNLSLSLGSVWRGKM